MPQTAAKIKGLITVSSAVEVHRFWKWRTAPVEQRQWNLDHSWNSRGTCQLEITGVWRAARPTDVDLLCTYRKSRSSQKAQRGSWWSQRRRHVSLHGAGSCWLLLWRGRLGYEGSRSWTAGTKQGSTVSQKPRGFQRQLRLQLHLTIMFIICWLGFFCVTSENCGKCPR